MGRNIDVRRLYEVLCDAPGCHLIIAFDSEEAPTWRNAAGQMRWAGWRIPAPGGVYLCPKHATEETIG